jgi:hypothetical protein
VIVPVAVSACVLLPICAGARPARPAVSLVASPAHVALAGRARQTIRVTNSGSEAVVVDVGRAGFALDLRGRPRIRPRRPGPRFVASWLTVRPRRLALRPRGTASLTISSRLPPRAQPGDHSALVLLTTRPRLRGGLTVRMRLGIVVAVRAPGRIVHHLELLALRVRRAGRSHLLDLRFANRGNVTEALSLDCLGVSLHRGVRGLARLRPVGGRRDVLPRSRGIVEIRYRGPVRGWVRARVEPFGRRPCGRGLRGTFRIRL